MSFYFLDIRMLAFKKQFLYKYMEEKPTPQPPPQPEPRQPHRQGMPKRPGALLSSLPHVATIS